MPQQITSQVFAIEPFGPGSAWYTMPPTVTCRRKTVCAEHVQSSRTHEDCAIDHAWQTISHSCRLAHHAPIHSHRSWCYRANVHRGRSRAPKRCRHLRKTVRTAACADDNARCPVETRCHEFARLPCCLGSRTANHRVPTSMNWRRCAHLAFQNRSAELPGRHREYRCDRDRHKTTNKALAGQRRHHVQMPGHLRG